MRPFTANKTLSGPPLHCDRAPLPPFPRGGGALRRVWHNPIVIFLYEVYHLQPFLASLSSLIICLSSCRYACPNCFSVLCLISRPLMFSVCLRLEFGLSCGDVNTLPLSEKHSFSTAVLHLLAIQWTVYCSSCVKVKRLKHFLKLFLLWIIKLSFRTL